MIKIGTSSLTHTEPQASGSDQTGDSSTGTGESAQSGQEVVLVSSGAIAVGCGVLGFQEKPEELDKRQACAAVGQARLMMIYQKLCSEYGQKAGQILMTKNTMLDNLNRMNARNTFNALLKMGVIPIVNENDTISI